MEKLTPEKIAAMREALKARQTKAVKTETAAETVLPVEGPLDTSAADDLAREEAIKQAPAPAEAVSEKAEEPHLYTEEEAEIHGKPVKKKEELPVVAEKEKAFEVFVSAAREFYQQLKAEAEKSILSWEKYSPEDQKTLLEMEVKTFLRELMEEYGIKGGKAEDYLINEIRKGLTVPAENSPTEKTPVIEAPKEEVKEAGVEKPRAIEKEQKFSPQIEKTLREISELYKKYMNFSGFDRLLPDGEAQKVEKFFREKFRPFRMGVTNAMERRRSENPPPPDFQKENDGSYYFIELSKTLNFFVVVPRLETVLLESAYGPGAMGEVFEAPGYDSRKLYDIMEVVRPAIFKKDEQGKFQLIEKGEISLKER